MEVDPTAPSSGARASDYARTMPADRFSVGGVHDFARAAATEAATADAAPAEIGSAEHTLRGISLTRRLLEYGYTAKHPTTERFQVRKLLGAGANGDVLAIQDHNLEREIAVKFLKATVGPGMDEIEQFIEEAQITASLQHPSVLPVYEIDVNERGRVYFTMKKIEGRSLGDSLALSTLDRRDERIATFNKLVSVFLNLGHALSYAHHRGIIHQDIKPDNIMLGDFGEILLVDWGSAARLSDPARRQYGTPLYMSPEQARLEPSDQLSDVYCLGATLFHALTLRPPMWSDDEEDFWRKKRTGELDAPTRPERRLIPAQLLAIALKALAPQPSQRYGSIEDMVGDLERYQAGLAVSAHRDSASERLVRWYRRNARAVWSASAVATISLALVAMLYGERLKEIATWGSPIVVETFDDATSWRDRWQVYLGGFEWREGRLISTDALESLLLWPHRLEGDTAVEFDAEVLPGAQLGDLSLFWVPELSLQDDGSPRLSDFDAYHFLFGAHHGSYSVISAASGAQLAYDDAVPIPGRRHHVRVEIVDRRLSMLIDGRTAAVYDDLLPFSGGYVMLYSVYKGHAFDNVRIFSRGVAQKVPATAVGDAFLQKGLYQQASEQYAKVWNSHPSSAIGAEAHYKLGLCAYLGKADDRAFSVWDGMRGGRWDGDIELHRLETLYRKGLHHEAASGLARLYERADEALRRRVIIQWSIIVAEIRRGIMYDQREVTGLDDYLDVHDRLFPDERVADRSAAFALNALRRFQEVVERYPRQRYERQFALQCLGRDEDILREYPDDSDVCVWALERMGRSEEAPRRFDLQLGSRTLGLVLRGLIDDAFTLDAHDSWALLASGRLDEILATQPTGEFRRRAAMLVGTPQTLAEWKDDPIALLAAGRIDEAWQRHRQGFGHDLVVRQAKGLEDFIRGERAVALTLLDGGNGHEFHQDDQIWMFQFLILPFMHELTGEPGAVDRACATIIATRRFAFEQHPWFCARFLAGQIGEAEVLAQPHALNARAHLTFCRALRAEREGRRDDAAREYRAYMEMPRWIRSLDLEPVVERFARWRISELARP
ncbi:MAG: protein kinase [Planctomycetes bacterium]|nr:protein kinase [Planctomycetota bacterium]